MLPPIGCLVNDYLSLRRMEDAPLSREVRRTVNRYFGNRLPDPKIGEPIDLYIPSHKINEAQERMRRLVKESKVNIDAARLIMIATDTTSAFTRPPTALLVGGISTVVNNDHNIVVCILPSYSTDLSPDLFTALQGHRPRVHLIDKEDARSLFYTTALIDQAEVFITPDTGVMHLAAARKVLVDKLSCYHARNSTKIIALFGATNPGLFGYSRQTTILGRGRREQKSIQPGLYKNAMTPKPGVNYFSHISDETVQNALMDALYATMQ